MRIGCVRPRGRRLTGREVEPGFFLLLGALVLFLLFLFLTPASAAEAGSFSLPSLQLGIASADSPADVALSLQILGLLTVLSLAPAILLMITSFTRIVIVLGFVQRAIGLQQSPPQQVVTGLALFLTLLNTAYGKPPTIELDKISSSSAATVYFSCAHSPKSINRQH